MQGKRIGALIIGASLLLAAGAEARRGARHRGATWVPERAWQAVKREARTSYDPQARLFKTSDTKRQSLGLKGQNSDAWIVGARAPRQTAPTPGFVGFRPYKPAQKFYLVTKDANKRWKATPLAGMGGYLSKVDAASANPRVGVGVALHPVNKVGHGVEVQNTRYLSVTKGEMLAKKQNGTTCTVFVKGTAANSPYAIDATATLRAAVPPPAGSWCGTPLPKNIPVSFSQVMFAQPMAANR